MKKVTVSWQIGTHHMYGLDFGNFKAPKRRKINVPSDMWEKYCIIRNEFEMMQTQLMSRITGKGLTKQECDFLGI